MTPVILLTGFLGSGKTTLLSRLLASEEFRDTAVIINEFGAISIDHDLIRSADETIITLGNGCLCCKTSSDVAATLDDLRRRRDKGEIGFRRVIIETSGLADPVPLLHALSSDSVVAMSFMLSSVITVIDAVAGTQTLKNYEEARRQVAMADVLLISKTDLVSDYSGLKDRVESINSTAHIVNAQDWQGSLPEDQYEVIQRRLIPESAESLHSHQYSTVSIIRNTPITAAAIPLFLEGLASHLGDRLLRLKGFISLAEYPEKPMIVHAVQHMVYVPQWLSAWPSADRRSRIVLIGHDIPANWPKFLLETIEAEVNIVSSEQKNQHLLSV